MIRKAVERGHKPGRGEAILKRGENPLDLIGSRVPKMVNSFLQGRESNSFLKIILTKCILNIVRFSYTWCILYQP